MGVLFTNNASTTLSAAISSTGATSISVASSSTFPAPGAGEYFYATIDDGTNIEIVKVTAVSGTTWTVVRASDNTSAATFANGTTIQLRAAAALLTDIQQNIAAKSANQTVYNATTASSATTYNVGTDPQNEANAMVFLDGVMQHHDTFSFSGSTLTFDAAPSNGLKLEVIIDNLINLQSSNLTVDTFTATNGQTAFTLSDTPAAEDNLIVFIEGVFQNQDSYSISTNTLTMSAGVTTNRKVVVYIINPVNIGTPSDGTVTSAKLSGNITTPGTLTVGSYDVAFDSPTFVVDNSNSRVGLGTASPSVPVDIVGDVKMSSTLDLTSHLDMPDSANVKLGTGDDLLLYHDGTNSYIANTTGALKIATETSGIAVTIGHTTSETTVADNLTVTGTITGTLATAAQTNITSLGTLTGLTVDGATTTNALKGGSTNFDIYQTTSDGSDNRRTRIGGGGDVAQSRGAFIELAGNEHSDTGDLILNAGDVSGGDILLKTDNTTRIFVKDDGKVGIGTATPDCKLEIAETASDTGVQLKLNGNRSSNGNVGDIVFENASDSVAMIRANRASANDAADMLFYTQVAGGSNAEKMRITSAGNAYIGQTASSGVRSTDPRVQVSGTDLASSSLALHRYQANAYGPYLHFAKSRNGTVGSHTIVQDGDVVGSLGFYPSDGNDFVSHCAEIVVEVDGTPGSDDVPGRIMFKTTADGSASSTERMRIDSSGNVGIGTSSPQELLHLTATTPVFRLEGGSRTYQQFVDSTSFYIRDVTAGANRVILDSSGKLSVGATAPSHKIEAQDGGVASKYDGDDHVAIRGLSAGQYIQYGSGRPLKFVSVDTYPNSGATVNGQITAGVLQTYNGFSVKKNATTDLSGSAHLDAAVKFAFYQYVLTSTDISNGYGDVEHKVYRDNYMGHTVALFDVSANVVYTGIKADSWITNTDRYASGDITRCFLGSSAAAGDKVRLIVFWHSAYG